MELLLDFLLSALFEIVGPLIVEALGRLIGDPVRDFFGRERAARGAGTVIAYAGLGLLIGAGSLWLAPHHLFATQAARIANLALAPLLAGAAMAAVDRFKGDGEGAPADPWTAFACGYAFALCFAGVRAVWAG